MTPFPIWVRWAWAGFFAYAALEHLPHVRRMRGAHRLWHVGHIVMSVGMAWMFIPPEYRSTTRWPWQVLFAVTSVLAVGYALLRLAAGVRIDLSWIAIAAGQIGMWYMWVMRDGLAREWVTYVGAAWFLAEAVGWFTQELTGRRERGYLPRSLGPFGRRASVSGEPQYLAGATPLAYRLDLRGCISLGLMALGMAYMLIGMQIELR